MRVGFRDFNGKPIAGEMCQVLNNHWGYAENDLNYKLMQTFIEDLVDCRDSGCNYLLNTGLRGDGSVNPMDKAFLQKLGQWIVANKDFIYGARPTDYVGENCQILEDDTAWYVVVKGVQMSANVNVGLSVNAKAATVDSRIQGKAYWLDSGEPARFENGKLFVQPFAYGTSYSVRVARIEK